MRISLYLPGPTGPCTCHSRGEDPTQVFKGRSARPGAVPDRRVQQRVFLSGIDVAGSTAKRLVVAFGDSITDGVGSTIAANRRWPDLFAERVLDAGVNIGIVNAGIAGNYLTRTGEYPSFGEAGLARFKRDALEVPGATDTVILLGINDIGGEPDVGERLIAGYRQLIADAHARRIRVFLGTIPPFRGSTFFTEAGEQSRLRVNAWIRADNPADGIIDFDRALRDPANPGRVDPRFHSGDWLHPNDDGYRVMARAIDPAIFAKPR
nr:SGNH/GDSL hydrolase family protein [Novosphingobium flavum]